jgi:ketosteroid isomerase-like protein
MSADGLREVLDGQSEAYTSGDIGKFLAHWSDDATAFPSSAKSPLVGLAKVSKWIRSNAQVPQYTMSVLKEEIGEDIAYQFCRYRGANRNSAGQRAKFSGYLTRILRRDQSGSWKIVHAAWKDDE